MSVKELKAKAKRDFYKTVSLMTEYIFLRIFCRIVYNTITEFQWPIEVLPSVDVLKWCFSQPSKFFGYSNNALSPKKVVGLLVAGVHNIWPLIIRKSNQNNILFFKIENPEKYIPFCSQTLYLKFRIITLKWPKISKPYVSAGQIWDNFNSRL